MHPEYADATTTSFRFQHSLRAAIHAEAARRGIKPAVLVAQVLCDRFKLDYVPAIPGRPWPKKPEPKPSRRMKTKGK